MYVSISKFRINFEKGLGLANANFFLKIGPFENLKTERKFFVAKTFGGKMFRLPINSRKIQDSKKVNKV